MTREIYGLFFVCTLFLGSQLRTVGQLVGGVRSLATTATMVGWCIVTDVRQYRQVFVSEEMLIFQADACFLPIRAGVGRGERSREEGCMALMGFTRRTP